jgi:serine/threonine-protein kinase
MSITSSTRLVDVLREWQFLEAPQLERLARNRLLAYANPRDLTRDLVHQGWLSAYQANRLIQGHGHELVLGPYRLIEPLGTGTLGRVFKARDLRMNRLVALKVIHKERLTSFRSIEHLYHKATVVARLSHPNIVRAFGAGQVGNSYVFATEYLPGIDLEALVEQKGRLSAAEACDYIRQAGLGLQYALERGVTHRNIKPRNLIVIPGARDHAPVIKLVDFCLSLMESDNGAEPPTPTELGQIAGNVDFMSPEQAANPRAADTRSDVFSLGCTLYYLLTAKLPFPADSLADRLLARYRADAPSVRELAPDAPAGLEIVVARMLSRDPAQRYQSPGEAAQALEPFLPQSVSGSVCLPPAPISTSPVRQPPAPTPRSTAVEPGEEAVGDSDPALFPLDILPGDLSGRNRFLVGAGTLLFLAAITVAVAFLGDGRKKTVSVKARPAPADKPASLTATKPAVKTGAEAQLPDKATPPAVTKAPGKPAPNPAIQTSPPASTPEPASKPKDPLEVVAKTEPGPKAATEPEPKPRPELEASAESEPKVAAQPEAEPRVKPRHRTDKLAIPDRAGQLKAEMLIKDLFKPEYARKAPGDLRELAEKLHQQGIETRDDLTARFVLFREAHDLASQAGDLDGAFKAVDVLAREYAVDAIVMKTVTLEAASRTTKLPAGNKPLVEAALRLVDEAVVSDRYDVASRLLTVADVAARRVTAGLAQVVEARTSETQQIEKEYKQVKPALETLAGGAKGKDALSPKDCLAVGRFLCVMKRDWASGLPLLARGSDAALQALAKADLAEPTEAAAQVKVGDTWWDLAESQAGFAKKQLRVRARYWYKQALPGLKGLTRTKVERRIHPPKT